MRPAGEPDLRERRAAPRRVAAILNPRARRGPDEVRAALLGACPAGVELHVLVSETPGAATDLAREWRDRVDLVAAAGGDGTVAEVATGLAHGEATLGIIPAGSTNVVAQECGIPRALPDAASLLFSPHDVVRRDLGTCGDRRFLHMAGAGFDARFFARSDADLKRKVGWLAYLPAAAAAFADPPARFVVRVDGSTVDAVAPLVVVANGASVIHPAIRLGPRIRPDDGLLEVLVFTATTPAALARTLASFAVGRLPDSPDVIWLSGARVSIETDHPVPVQLDGDVSGDTPVEFGIDPLAIGIAAPRQ